MRLPVLALPLLCSLFLSVHGSAQTALPASKDSQAVLVLGQCLNAAGGAQAFATVQDFTASGTVIYHWAGQDVQGSVTVRGRGSEQFRLDANLPIGTRAWSARNGLGQVKEADGTMTAIPYHNSVNLGALSFPFVSILAALGDPLTTISYLGLVDIEGRKAHQVRVQHNFSSQGATDDIPARLATKDFLIDAVTYSVLETRDMVHPKRDATQDFVREIRFGDFRLTNGMLVPFSVAERVAGQATWAVQLDSISFNTGLTDADFQL